MVVSGRLTRIKVNSYYSPTRVGLFSTSICYSVEKPTAFGVHKQWAQKTKENLKTCTN